MLVLVVLDQVLRLRISHQLGNKNPPTIYLISKRTLISRRCRLSTCFFFITVWFLLPGQLKDYYPLGRRPCPKVLGILITRPFLPLLETKEPKKCRLLV